MKAKIDLSCIIFNFFLKFFLCAWKKESLFLSIFIIDVIFIIVLDKISLSEFKHLEHDFNVLIWRVMLLIWSDSFFKIRPTIHKERLKVSHMGETLNMLVSGFQRCFLLTNLTKYFHCF